MEGMRYSELPFDSDCVDEEVRNDKLFVCISLILNWIILFIVHSANAMIFQLGYENILYTGE